MSQRSAGGSSREVGYIMVYLGTKVSNRVRIHEGVQARAREALEGYPRGLLHEAWHPEAGLRAGRPVAYHMPSALRVGPSRSPVVRNP
jgi:hypothetical protein